MNILAGAVIGEQGFGVAGDASGPVDVPHLGRVIIQDRVTIGANSCVDRGVFDDTVIGEDAKIDNLCHVAHNCTIGRGVLIAAFGGISGSTQLGDGVTLGGRVGIADHRKIGAGRDACRRRGSVPRRAARRGLERLSGQAATQMAARGGLAEPQGGRGAR